MYKLLIFLQMTAKKRSITRVLFILIANLLDGNRQAETTFEDLFIRKFIYATWHDTLASEIIIKRRLNIINIVFFIQRAKKRFTPRQVYFLSGYTEELLSSLLKCVVKVEFQSVADKADTIFRNW
jgi:small subunit ribosomal protein S24